MLRIIQSNSAARAKSYFSTADYYSEGQELVGWWRGKGAERLGLSGMIQKEDWDRLCDNEHPGTGEPLTVRRRNERRVGYDLTFNVPKSVSLFFGLTQDGRIVRALREAVRDTMDEIEADAKCRVRQGGKDEDRDTGNLVWGEYIHFTGRPVGGIPDPALHVHAFAFNATFDPVEQRWKAAQFGDIKGDARYHEAVFHSNLARRMEEHGLETRRTRERWELAGFDKATLDKFSRRTKLIEAEARRKGITDPKAKAELGALTRESKSNHLTMRQLSELWVSRLTQEERETVDVLARRFGKHQLPEHPGIAREAIGRSLDHCFERASVVPERTLVAEALRQSVGKASPTTIQTLLSEQSLIRARRDGRLLVTTREVLAEESRMLAFAREGRGACRPISSAPHSFSRPWLNDQQRAAVKQVLHSRDRIVLIRGGAGTGKTTMMQEAREAVEQAGTRVLAFAPSASATDVLRTEGFESANTVARLLVDPELQSDTEGALIWIDEAGLIGTKTMSQLFDLANRLHARVVLSGDVRQHGSVERGAALRLLEDEAGLKPAELKEIQRQQDQYKSAVSDISEGRIADGFNRLDRLGWIQEVPDDTRYQAIAAAYLDAVRSNKTALVVSPTHLEGDRITVEIRHQLRHANLLGTESREFTTLTPLHLTGGQRRDPLTYEPGQVVLFHQNAKGFRKGQRLSVGKDPIPLDQAERFTVYQPKRIELAVGDRIRITKNGRTVDDKPHRLNNGDLFTVEGFTPDGHLRLDNGWTLPADYGHLTYGLVVTSHASQSKTVARVIVGQSSSSFPASSREQFYVSVSRGREQVLVFTDDKADLLRAVTGSDSRISGTELVAGAARHRHRSLSRPGLQERLGPSVGRDIEREAAL